MLIDVDVVNGVPTGTNLRVLLDRTTDLSVAAWSPLGDKIAFVDLALKTIEVIPLAGENPVVVYTSPSPLVPHYPAWNRDASLIAFSERDVASDAQVIRAVNVTTGEVTTILGPELSQPINPTGAWIEGLDWGRTRDVLTFSTGFDPYKVYTLELPGGSPTFVADGRGPTWSPNDTQIVFMGRQKFSKVNVATGQVTSLSTGGGWWPDWRRF